MAGRNRQRPGASRSMGSLIVGMLIFIYMGVSTLAPTQAARSGFDRFSGARSWLASSFIIATVLASVIAK